MRRSVSLSGVIEGNDVRAGHGSDVVSKINTLNVCVSHLPFPKRFDHYVDVMISPVPMTGPRRVVHISDDYFGEQGHALSEYAQLLWFYENLKDFTTGYEYVRLFQYRRFVARASLGDAGWNSFSTWIPSSRLELVSDEFDRFSASELFNQAMLIRGGVPFQYAMSHVLEDLLNFSKFLLEINLLTPLEVVEFLTSDELITACSTGIYAIKTFEEIFAKLKLAANFIYST